MQDKVKTAIEAAEKRFNELNKQKNEIETELVKLQGEYRGLTSLLDEATTIKAEPKKSQSGRKSKS